MTHTRMGSEDGHEVHLYVQGQEYEVGQWLASWFFCKNAAVLVRK